MPRIRLLRMLDPHGEHYFNAPQMRLLIKPYAEEFRRVVLQDKIYRKAWMSRAHSRFIATSNYSEPLRPGDLCPCPVHARLASGMACVRTAFSSSPFSIPALRFRRGTSEQPFPIGRSASQSAVWQAA